MASSQVVAEKLKWAAERVAALQRRLARAIGKPGLLEPLEAELESSLSDLGAVLRFEEDPYPLDWEANAPQPSLRSGPSPAASACLKHPQKRERWLHQLCCSHPPTMPMQGSGESSGEGALSCQRVSAPVRCSWRP